MLIASTLLFLWAQAPTSRGFSPTTIIFLIFFIGSLLGWFIASVLGFARARAFGPATRWFAFSCVCMLCFNLHLLAFAIFGLNETDVEKVMSFGLLALLFPLLGSICAIIGFLRLTNPRP